MVGLLAAQVETGNSTNFIGAPSLSIGTPSEQRPHFGDPGGGGGVVLQSFDLIIKTDLPVSEVPMG